MIQDITAFRNKIDFRQLHRASLQDMREWQHYFVNLSTTGLLSFVGPGLVSITLHFPLLLVSCYGEKKNDIVGESTNCTEDNIINNHRNQEDNINFLKKSSTKNGRIITEQSMLLEKQSRIIEHGKKNQKIGETFKFFLLRCDAFLVDVLDLAPPPIFDCDVQSLTHILKR